MVQITLRAARIISGLDLEEVALKCDTTTDNLRKYEEDSSNIPHDLIRRLIELYRVPFGLLYFGQESDSNVKMMPSEGHFTEDFLGCE